MEFQTFSKSYEKMWDNFTCIIEVSLGLSVLFSSAVVGGGWAGLPIDIGVVDTSSASNGGSGALKIKNKVNLKQTDHKQN